METTDVVIAGAGPTGLMLAFELRLAGVDVTLLDRLPARTGESRAGGIHARTMEIFDQRGLLANLLPQGRPSPAGHFGGLPLDFSDFDTRYPCTLSIWQPLIERELDLRATESGAPVQWRNPVVGFRQDGSGVTVEIGDSQPRRRIRASYLVGCDGGRSAVRTIAGIGFSGTDATMTGMLADVELADPPVEPFFGHRRGAGDFSAVQFEPGWYRLIMQRHDTVRERGAEPGFEDFRAAFTELAGTDFGMHSPRWVSHFADAALLADRYRDGRVFLAGDAAHVHHPAGGQGLNLGVQDAVNLGWKLAAAVRGGPEALLDSYESERRPVAARVLHNVRAQIVLSRPGAHVDALRDVFSDLMSADQVRHRLGLMVTALDIRYETGCDHPLAGRRVPDADLRTDQGDTRIAELLRAGRPILLRLDGDRSAEPSRWRDRIEVIDAHARTERWSVAGVGEIPVPAAVLIRPDGYVAWVATDAGLGGLSEALDTWIGG